VVFLASTENPDVVARPPLDPSADDPVQFQFGEHLAVVETADDGSGWHWLEPDGKRALIVVNESASPVRTNLMLTVTSLGQARDFYVFPYDGPTPSNVPLLIQRLPADRETDVLVKDVTIPPGESYLMLYTAHPPTAVGNVNRNFAVLDRSLLSGRLAFDLTFDAPRGGAHRLEIRPYGLDAFPATVTASLDDVALNFERQDLLGEPTFITTVALEPGGHTITVQQAGSENYAIRVISGGGPGAGPAPGHALPAEESPTSYDLEISADNPAIMIFGESFDPRWVATSTSAPLDQYRVNGFANAYIIPAGEQAISLSFGPQRLFVGGAIVSVTALALAVLAVAGMAIRDRISRSEGDPH
jgi:hypothetical protein